MKIPFQYLITAFLLSAAAIPAHATSEESVVRGGRLYDHWSKELAVRAPGQMHPLFVGKNAGVAPGESWRCSECHGWDYKGKHGIVGIKSPLGADPKAIVAMLKTPSHPYAEWLHESDLTDLANFISHGQIDMPGVIAAAASSKVSLDSTRKLFSTVCASCHGLTGDKQRTTPPLGDAARQRPAEVLHVVLNGHPGGVMPALSALGAPHGARMLAFLQTLPAMDMAASIAHGGRLYDDWQLEAGSRRQSLPHPAYPANAHFANDVSLTWRCKECHGWDYKGNQGRYATGLHATGIKGIRSMANVGPAQVLAVLRDSTHRYDAVLVDRDLVDVANFVSYGLIDMDAVIDPKTGLAKGDARRAGAYFKTICAGCHGIDGTKTVTAVPLGRIAKSNPWESLHKILNGHPDEKMPALRELELQLLLDILSYTQGLPQARQ